MLLPSSLQQNQIRWWWHITIVFFFSNIEKKVTTKSYHHFFCYNNTTQENNKKKWREGTKLTLKLLLWPVTSGSHLKRIVLATAFALLLQASSFALPL
jgi:hypothetical protein